MAALEKPPKLSAGLVVLLVVLLAALEMAPDPKLKLGLAGGAAVVPVELDTTEEEAAGAPKLNRAGVAVTALLVAVLVTFEVVGALNTNWLTEDGSAAATGAGTETLLGSAAKGAGAGAGASLLSILKVTAFGCSTLPMPNEKAGAAGSCSFLPSATSFAAVLWPNPKLNWAGAAAAAGASRTAGFDWGTSLTAAKPKLNLGTALLPADAEELAAADVAEPGRACSQQMHFAREMSFCAMHVSQSQFWAFCLATSCWNPVSALGASAAPNFKVGPPLLEPLLMLMADGVEEETDDDDDDELELELELELETAPSLLVLLGLLLTFRLGAWQATHSVALDWFVTRHVWHSHVLALGLKAAPKPEPDSGTRGFGFAGGGRAVFRGVSQATHLVASCLLESMQASHSQALADFLKRSPKPLAMGTIAG